MIDTHNSVTRMRIRELMDVRLTPCLNKAFLPGVWCLLAHGFSYPQFRSMQDGDYCESKRECVSQGRTCWIHVTGKKTKTGARWWAEMTIYGNPEIRTMAECLDKYIAREVDMAVGVQLARLDELLNEYDKRKEKDNDGEKQNSG